MARSREITEKTVIKSDELVAADWDDMTLKETQLLILAVGLIPEFTPSTMDKTIRVTITRSMMDEAFGLNNMTTAKLKELSDLLQTRKATIKPRYIELDAPTSPSEHGQLSLLAEIDQSAKDQSWESMVLVPTCRYVRGAFTITLNQDLNPHFLDLHNRVTRYRLGNIFNLTSAYHIHLYELLVMGDDDKSLRTVHVNPLRLREIVGAKNKYPKFTDFRRSVLDPAVDAINEHTDLQVTYELVRKGGPGVIKVIFSVIRTNGKAPILAPSSSVDLAQIDSELIDSSALPPAAQSPASSAIDTDNLMQLLTGAGVAGSSAPGLLEKFLARKPGADQEDLAHNLTMHLRAAREYMDSLRTQGKPVRTANILNKAVGDGWQPVEAPDPPQAAQTPRNDAPPVTVDYETVVAAIEADPSLMEGFVQFIQRPLDRVSIALLAKSGIRSLGLEDAIKNYGLRLINSGRLGRT